MFAVTEPTPGLGREKPLDFIVSGINTHHPILFHWGGKQVLILSVKAIKSKDGGVQHR